MDRIWIQIRAEGDAVKATAHAQGSYAERKDGSPATVSASSEIDLPEELAADIIALRDNLAGGMAKKLKIATARAITVAADRKEI